MNTTHPTQDEIDLARWAADAIQRKREQQEFKEQAE
jgi:hypothetical protein